MDRLSAIKQCSADAERFFAAAVRVASDEIGLVDGMSLRVNNDFDPSYEYKVAARAYFQALSESIRSWAFESGDSEFCRKYEEPHENEFGWNHSIILLMKNQLRMERGIERGDAEFEAIRHIVTAKVERANGAPSLPVEAGTEFNTFESEYRIPEIGETAEHLVVYPDGHPVNDDSTFRAVCRGRVIVLNGDATAHAVYRARVIGHGDYGSNPDISGRLVFWEQETDVYYRPIFPDSPEADDDRAPSP